MPFAPVLARRFTFLTLLRWSLLGGALYDLGFALVIAFAPEVPARIFGLPIPAERFYLWLIAVFLTMLAGFYLAAAHDPRRYGANIAVAIVGRTLGSVAFCVAAHGHPALAGLYVVGAGDLLFAALHTAFWLPYRQAA
jgi:hypothetical protein